MLVDNEFTVIDGWVVPLDFIVSQSPLNLDLDLDFGLDNPIEFNVKTGNLVSCLLSSLSKPPSAHGCKIPRILATEDHVKTLSL